MPQHRLSFPQNDPIVGELAQLIAAQTARSAPFDREVLRIGRIVHVGENFETWHVAPPRHEPAHVRPGSGEQRETADRPTDVRAMMEDIGSAERIDPAWRYQMLEQRFPRILRVIEETVAHGADMAEVIVANNGAGQGEPTLSAHASIALRPKVETFLRTRMGPA